MLRLVARRGALIGSPVLGRRLFSSSFPATYHELHAASLRDPVAFWAEQERLADLHWFRRPTSVFDSSNPPFYKWFSGGSTNMSYNCLDRHVRAGHGENIALIHDSPITHSPPVHLTYREMLERVSVFAAALKHELGVQAGDRVVLSMPMVPETVIAMLACARIGAVHSVVFGGFSAVELGARINHAKPAVVIAATCGVEPTRVVDYKQLLDDALLISEHKPRASIILQRPQLQVPLGENEHDWKELEREYAGRGEAATPLPSTAPLYTLYTSGTTGAPKAVVRDIAGHMVQLHASMRWVYNISRGDVWAAFSDLGWVVGHSYICYAPLLVGSTSVLFEGKPVGMKDGVNAYARVIKEHNVKSAFTAPTAIRAIRAHDATGACFADTRLDTLFLAGERCDRDTFDWISSVLGPDTAVVDHYWQTESGSPMLASFRGLGDAAPGIVAGSAGMPVPGYDFHVMNAETKREIPRVVEGLPREKLAPAQMRDEDVVFEHEAHEHATEEGVLVVKLPLPPGALTTLYENDALFVQKYLSTFPGYYDTGDHGFIDSSGHVWPMARTDDDINVAGHRLSTGKMEEAVNGHEAVVECAVVGVHDDLKGHLPVGLVVLAPGGDYGDYSTVKQEIAARVRRRVGPVACYKTTYIVEKLPKTRSGKVLRRTVRAIINEGTAEFVAVPATIEDASVLEHIDEVVNGNKK